MRKKTVVILTCCAFGLLLVCPLNAHDWGASDRTFTVMTRNLDAGSDFAYVLQAATDPSTTELQLLLAITNTYQEMIASDIPGRARRIAMEVHARQPYLIGLQEVTTLRTGSMDGPADTVVVDGIQALLDALAARGLHYKAVAVQTNAVVDLPAFDATGRVITVGFTDSDAVLARTDLPISELKISDVDIQHLPPRPALHSPWPDDPISARMDFPACESARPAVQVRHHAPGDVQSRGSGGGDQ